MKIGKYIVHPIEPEEPIDDCNWDEWSCEIETPEGELITGSIEGDGYAWAESTLRDEDGNLITS